jgi:hypothetical protein
MHWLSPFFYMKAIFGPLEERINSTDINRDEICFRRRAGYTISDHTRNEEILEALRLGTFDEKLRRYKSKWSRLITRTDNSRIPKIMLNYRTDQFRHLGRTLKRKLEDAEIGLSNPKS